MSQPHRPSTAQEIFNTVALHLITQGRQARDHAKCLYHAPNGTKCAVGILIPDDMYSPVVEAKPVRYLLRYIPKELHLHISLLENLQDAHDNSDHPMCRFDMEILKKDLRWIAKHHELDDQVLSIA